MQVCEDQTDLEHVFFPLLEANDTCTQLVTTEQIRTKI